MLMRRLQRVWNDGYGLALTLAAVVSFAIIAITYLILQPSSITGWTWWPELGLMCSLPMGPPVPHMASAPLMANVNAADLERLGITREQWGEQQARFDAEQPLEVRVVGGAEALRAALKAAGAEFWITHHTPEQWHRCDPYKEWCGGCYIQYDDGLHHHGKPHEHD